MRGCVTHVVLDSLELEYAAQALEVQERLHCCPSCYCGCNPPVAFRFSP